MNPYLVLVDRYLNLLKALRPDVYPKKDSEGSLELHHALWMLLKMKDPSFKPKTTESAWISWVQASFYLNGLIVIKHEISISRDIMRQYNGSTSKTTS